MNEVINSYLLAQILLSISFVFLWVVNKNTRLTKSFVLKASYILILFSILFPLGISSIEVDNPLGPIFKVWNEPGVVSASKVEVGSVNVRMVKTAVTPQMGVTLSRDFSYLILITVLLAIFYQVIKSTVAHFKFLTELKSAILIRKIGKVRVWLLPNTGSPFSLYMLRAHIFVSQNTIENPYKYRMVMAHEIQHHRQFDTLFVYILEGLRILFSINPLLQKLNQQTLELQELACDEAVVGRKSFNPNDYGLCLLAFADQKGLSSPIGAVGMAVQPNQLKRRVEEMFIQGKNTTQKAFAVVTLTGLLLVAGVGWAFRGVVSDQKITLKQAQSMATKASMDQEIPIVVDKKVLYWLNRAVGSEESRRYMRNVFSRMQNYERMIKGKLSDSSVPEELIAIPFIESGFRNHAESPARAKGMWQFIPSTARRFGLKVGRGKDQRLNPELSTEAAIKYLSNLNALFNNWYAAITAYNLGERRLKHVILENGHNDIFKLAREGKLGRESGNYAPKLMAAMLILKNPELVE